MINLCLVVIATQFSETKRRETERMLVERAQRARQKHRSQSNSTITSSSGLDVGGCYVEVVRYLEYLINTARRRLARLVRRLRRRYAAAGQPAVDRPRALVSAADSSSPRRRHRRRRRRHRDLDPRPSDAPSSAADNAVRCRPEQLDSTPATHGVVACRAAAHAVSDTSTDLDAASASFSPRRTKPTSVADSECLQSSNTGLSP